MGDVLTPRDRAYLDIIHHGLVLLRNYAHGGQSEFCPVEAEHLHEISTLIGEGNERRHVYYLRGTRGLYLQQLRALGHAGYLEQVSIWYTHPWRVLADTAGLRLLAWDQGAEPHAAADPARLSASATRSTHGGPGS
ncbi:hypothetical protein J0H58_34945 [bacterium]|nr:hypothetical protein [bacterium]